MDQSYVSLNPALNPKRKKNRKRQVLIGGVIILLLAVIICVGLSIYVGLSLTHPQKKPILLTPKNYGIPYQDIQFKSADNKTKLSGWVLEPNQTAKMTLVFAHGYRGNRYEDNVPFLPLAKQLLLKGYRIVMFDFRYSGKSGGEMTTVGAKEKYDLLGAVNWTKRHYHQPIGLYGVSMGASTAILTASMTKDVTAVVADSPFSDLSDYLKKNMPVWTHLPNFPFTPLILHIIPIITDLNPADASPISVLKKIAPRPILFIHSTLDGAIPYTESVKMERKDPNYFTLWLTKGKDHVKSYIKDPGEYVKRLDKFYMEALQK